MSYIFIVPNKLTAQCVPSLQYTLKVSAAEALKEACFLTFLIMIIYPDQVEAALKSNRSTSAEHDTSFDTINIVNIVLKCAKVEKKRVHTVLYCYSDHLIFNIRDILLQGHVF